MAQIPSSNRVDPVRTKTIARQLGVHLVTFLAVGLVDPLGCLFMSKLLVSPVFSCLSAERWRLKRPINREYRVANEDDVRSPYFN